MSNVLYVWSAISLALCIWDCRCCRLQRGEDKPELANRQADYVPKFGEEPAHSFITWNLLDWGNSSLVTFRFWYCSFQHWRPRTVRKERWGLGWKLSADGHFGLQKTRLERSFSRDGWGFESNGLFLFQQDLIKVLRLKVQTRVEQKYSFSILNTVMPIWHGTVMQQGSAF